jgi:hypothetical protein
MASIVSAGTTSATALNMSADTTGVLQLASNNGTVALTVSTAQNIGIGTTSPSAKLVINSSYVSDTTRQLVISDTTGTSLSFGGTGGGVKWINSENTGGGGAYPLTFQTGGAEAMRIDVNNRVNINSTVNLGGIVQVNGNIAPVALASSYWGIDFGTSTSAGSYVTLANGATYDLADGAGCVWIYEQTSSVGLSMFNCAYGGTSIVANPQNNYTTTAGTASKTNVYYNGGNNKYRIQNNSGATYSYWIAGMRVRNNA